MIPILCLLFLSFLPISTTAEVLKPILVVPADGGEGLPYSSVSFRWKYDEDEKKSKQLEKQVLTNSLVLYEVNYYSDPGYTNMRFVGECKVTNPCPTCPLIYEKIFDARTYASSSECTGELRSNQWYKWVIRANSESGQNRASIAWFKTASREHRETIHLSLDKEIAEHMDPSVGVEHRGKTYTLESIYEKAGFKVDISLTEMPKPIYKETPTISEIIGFLRKTEYVNNLPPDGGTYWNVPVILFKEQRGIRTICNKIICFSIGGDVRFTGFTLPSTTMGKDKKKYSLYQIAIFSENEKYSLEKYKEIFENEKQSYLHTLAHELGHAIGAKHEFGDAYIQLFGEIYVSIYDGTSIMNELPLLSPEKWDYTWSARSLKHFYEEPLEKLQPIKQVD